MLSLLSPSVHKQSKAMHNVHETSSEMAEAHASTQVLIKSGHSYPSLFVKAMMAWLCRASLSPLGALCHMICELVSMH